MKETWDKRYKSGEYIYGILANEFLVDQLKNLKPGKILLPGDGEGRNAVFAAKQGWQVSAFDYSSSGKEKALSWAQRNNVKINYQVCSVDDFDTTEKFDLISIIYLHLPQEQRENFHKKLKSFLNDNGKVIVECFSKDQIKNRSGGPKNLNLLYSIDELKQDFADYNILHIEETEVNLNEGKLHQGMAKVIRLIATNS